MSSEKPQYSSYGITHESSTTSPLVLTGSEWTCLVLALDSRAASLCQEYLRSMGNSNAEKLLNLFNEAEELLAKMLMSHDSPISEMLRARIRHRHPIPPITGEGQSNPST